MAIPVNPALASAAMLNQQFQSVPINTCTPPGSEGAQCVPIQIIFTKPGTGLVFPAWVIDLGFGSPPAISQFSAVYIDATNSVNDIQVICPDTQHTVTCAGGKTLLAPVFTNKRPPKFYVLSKQNVTTCALDSVNIFALNVFLPELVGNNHFEDYNFFSSTPIWLPFRFDLTDFPNFLFLSGSQRVNIQFIEIDISFKSSVANDYHELYLYDYYNLASPNYYMNFHFVSQNTGVQTMKLINNSVNLPTQVASNAQNINMAFDLDSVANLTLFKGTVNIQYKNAI